MICAALFVAVSLQTPGFTTKVTGGEIPGIRAEIGVKVSKGVAVVEKFFSAKYPSQFEVEIFAHRSDLDAAMKKRWNAPPSEKWMVAAGISDTLLILSPRVWKTEAQGHDGEDAAHVQQIVTHELTHVYHGQVCPKHDFDGMDKMAWFIEGLATYAAGQLEGRHYSAEQAIAAGQAPKDLEAAWTGQYRYGVAGSIVRYVDRRYGRPKLAELLKTTSNEEALKLLGVTEKDLLEAWRKSIAQGY